MQAVKYLLRKLGILPYLKALKLLASGVYIPAPMMRSPTFNPDISHFPVLMEDYFRYISIGLAIQRILSENIPGSFAEAGVFRGDMSKFIHQLAPQRIYYLFDTFEGFPKQDLESCISKDSRFNDTSVEKVLQNIGDKRNIIIKKGYVPDTLAGLEDKQFALVLLDLDLYNPSMSSLNFFYPRLSKGGYLIVHDYNNPESNWACKRAVDEFMIDKPEKIIELADEWGTILFRKF